MLAIDQKVRDLISGDGTIEDIRKCLSEQGCRNLLQEGLRAAEAELTSLDEVMRVASVD